MKFKTVLHGFAETEVELEYTGPSDLIYVLKEDLSVAGFKDSTNGDDIPGSVEGLIEVIPSEQPEIAAILTSYYDMQHPEIEHTFKDGKSTTLKFSNLTRQVALEDGVLVLKDISGKWNVDQVTSMLESSEGELKEALEYILENIEEPDTVFYPIPV